MHNSFLPRRTHLRHRLPVAAPPCRLSVAASPPCLGLQLRRTTDAAAATAGTAAISSSFYSEGRDDGCNQGERCDPGTRRSRSASPRAAAAPSRGVLPRRGATATPRRGPPLRPATPPHRAQLLLPGRDAAMLRCCSSKRPYCVVVGRGRGRGVEEA